MDLSDGSDVEGGVDYDENALLGSDDEDAAQYSAARSGFGVSRSVKDGVYEAQQHIGEDGDVLDLELHDDDGLEFTDEVDGVGCSSSIHSRLAPVRVATISNNTISGTTPSTEPNTDSYQHQIPDNYEEYDDNEYDDHGILDVEDEDDEDSRNTRARFHNERNTDNNVSNSSNINNAASKMMPNFGNPIQTLGSGKPPMMDDNNRPQRNWGKNHQGPQHSPSHHHFQGQRPRFHHRGGMRNPLLGDRPHLNPNFNQFNRPRGMMMMNPNGPPHGGRMFPHPGGGGFNFINQQQPPRIPNPHMREPCPPFPTNQGGFGPPPPRRPMLHHDPSMQQQQIQIQLQGPNPPMNNTQPMMRQNNPRMQIRQQRPRGGPQTNMSRHVNPNNPNGWRNSRPPHPQFQQRMPMNPNLGQPNNNNMHFMPGPHNNMFPPPQQQHQDPAGNMFLEQQQQQGIIPQQHPGEIMPQGMQQQYNMFPNMQNMQQQQFAPPPSQQLGFQSGNIGSSLLGPPGSETVIHSQSQQQNPFFQQQLQPQPHFNQQQQQVLPSNPWPEPQQQQPPPTQNSWISAAAPLHPGPHIPPNYNLPQGLEIQSAQNGNFILSHHQQQQQQMLEQGLVHHTVVSRSAAEVELETPSSSVTSSYPRSSFERNAELYQQREQESRSHEKDRYASSSSRSEHDGGRHERRGSPHERRNYEDRNYDDDRGYDDRRGGYSHNEDRYPPKRKYDRESYGSPEKSRSRNDRPLSPRPPPPRDRKADELLKIREEAKKTIGLDDDYIRKLEDQKRLREEILRKKAASRKGKLTGDEPDSVSSSTSSAQEIRVAEKSGRPSIYINPKAFRGDLSALKLKNIEQGTLKTTTATQIMNHTTTNVAGMTTKPRKVLKIVKDKYGNILSKSKVIVVPRLQPDARTTPA